MKKNIEWLKEEVIKISENWTEDIRGDFAKGLDRAVGQTIKLINQLDEPETLSEEWIDEHITDGHNVNLGDKVVYADELDGVLVPKQEEITEEQAWGVIHGKYGNETLQNNIDYVESQGYVVIEKPTIPQFVADYIKHEKNIRRPLFTSLDGLHKNPNTEKEVSDWYNANTAEYLRAWLDGYTVEEEQKYYVRENNYLLCKWKNEVMDYVEAVGREITDLVELKLTEQEIKDYDERYFAFAVKVEELEE